MSKAGTLSLLAFILFACASGGAAPPVSTNDAATAANRYLDALVGRWDMRGKLLGKSERYDAVGERVLQGGFVRFHMIDASTPPQYEADLYLGFDDKARDYVGHWMDRFGAAGARVVATGGREGNVLTIVFPYAEGKFRDTFTLHRSKGTWSLLIEIQARDETWSTFASFKLSPADTH